ncbi:hypothetical protein M3Y97_01091900 [Aphelenchoides bicaudatus]|nr:hypothetical protein M3Y97_01091900 [Aphelenchoides bicaudatus]
MPNLRQQIQQLILDGYEQEEIFEETRHQICRRQAKLSTATVKDLFSRSRISAFKKVPLKMRRLIKLIKTEYTNFNSVVEEQRCPSYGCRIQLLSQRYAIEIQNSHTKPYNSYTLNHKFYGAYLYDLFYGKRRELRVDTVISRRCREYLTRRIIVLDPQHILIHYEKESKNREYFTFLQLVEVDVEKGTFTVLDTKKVENSFSSIIVCSSSQFIYDVYRDNGKAFFRGRIVDFKIELDETMLWFKEGPTRMRYKRSLDQCKLEGGTTGCVP